MIRQFSVSRTAAAFMAVVGAMTVALPAHAQSLFDWAGDETGTAAGKQSVRFPTSYRPGELVVSFGDSKIYHVTAPGVASAYPIAIPRQDARWQGVTSVTMKRENPSWTPTAHMRAKNPRLPSWVPGGHPMNPLGVRAMYLGSSEYRIHGTDAPWTIGTAASSGCVRMYNQDVLDLYSRVNVGAKVTVTWNKYTGGSVMAQSMPETAAAAPAKRQYRPVQARRTTVSSAGE